MYIQMCLTHCRYLIMNTLVIGQWCFRHLVERYNLFLFTLSDYIRDLQSRVYTSDHKFGQLCDVSATYVFVKQRDATNVG